MGAVQSLFFSPYEALLPDAKMKAFSLAPNESLSLSLSVSMDLQTKLLKLNSDIGSKSHVEVEFKVLFGELPNVSLTAESPTAEQKLSVQVAVTQGVTACVTLDEKNSDMFSPNQYFANFTAGHVGAKFTVGAKIVTLSVGVDGAVGRSHRSMTLLKYDMDPALQHAELTQKEIQKHMEENVREDHKV